MTIATPRFLKPAAGVLVFFLAAAAALGQSRLFYLEIQGVGAYSTAADTLQTFSLTPEDVMQKPAVGFDFVERISGATRDYGVLAVQARLAYTQDAGHPFQIQVYNAYLRLKAGFADLWAGHNRPALGLDSVLDSHALLLPTVSMLGYGFDRDWGVGLQRDFSWGGAAASLTAGSGMPLYLHGNYLASARVAFGVPARDNYGIGLSAAHGAVLDTMGYALMSPDALGFTAAAVDASYFWRNLENRVEVMAGRRGGSDFLALFWRAGINLLAEGRLKLEAQPVLLETGADWNSQLAGGVTWLMTPELTARSMVLYDSARRDTRFVVQLYYYKGL
jgi:hypothetical protein